MSEILILIGLMCITVLAINATPIMLLRHRLDLLDMKDTNTKLRNRIIEFLSCAMCLGFWIGFIFHICYINVLDSILYAAIVSIGSELLDKRMRK